jgi:Cu/Ag efflux protein CusF
MCIVKTRLIIAALFALNIGVNTAYAAEEGAASAVNTQVGSESLQTVSATVTAVDQETREVTLTDADGNSHIITVSDEVKNLSQVEVGDQLDVRYYESVTFEVLPPGQADADMAALSVVDTAKKGEKPAASATSAVSFLATVEAIDKDAGTVALKGPEGNIKTVRVSNPDNLDKVAIGDELLITLTKSVGVSVSPAKSGG